MPNRPLPPLPHGRPRCEISQVRDLNIYYHIHENTKANKKLRWSILPHGPLTILPHGRSKCENLSGPESTHILLYLHENTKANSYVRLRTVRTQLHKVPEELRSSESWGSPSIERDAERTDYARRERSANETEHKSGYRRAQAASGSRTGGSLGGSNNLPSDARALFAITR